MNYFRPGLEESITLPPHPKVSDEIGEVVSSVASRTAEDVESIRNHDKNVFYAIEKYCKSKNVEFDRKAMKDLILQAGNIIGYSLLLTNHGETIEFPKHIAARLISVLATQLNRNSFMEDLL